MAYSTLRRIVTLNGNPQPEAVIKFYQTLGYDKELYQYMSDCLVPTTDQLLIHLFRIRERAIAVADDIVV